MKYIVLHGDGLVSGPRKDLGGKTVLQAAATPNMDALARQGEFGVAGMPADGLAVTSGMVQLAVLGYDPRKWYPGAGPLEATSLGVKLGEHDVAFRCSMVTLRSNAGGKDPYGEVKKLAPPVTVEGETDQLSVEEARELLEAVNEQLGSETIQFYPGTGSRHVMVWVNGKLRAACLDPREAIGKPVGDCLPGGDGADILRRLMEASLVILRDHPVNDQRREDGLKPVHCLWLWGQGRASRWPSFPDQHRVSGLIVATNDVRRGIGLCAGLEAVDPAKIVEAGGSDFLSRGQAAVQELAKKDLVYVHAEMPAAIVAGGDAKAAVKVVEEFDKRVVGTVLEGLAKAGPHRVLLVCDRGRMRSDGPQPVTYALCSGPLQKTKAGRRFNEVEAAAVADGARDATRLMGRLLAQG